ncbi:MAG: peptidase M28 [[Chlorobium] sp. 445]|nr:MAG: peptidase M28 [[Chlorobium] sp. 445]
MHRTIFLLCIATVFTFAQLAFAQQRSVSKTVLPEFSLSQAEVAAHIRFLAADELLGRMTGEMGNNVAARYIAEQFRLYGLKPLPDAPHYFQHVPLLKIKPPQHATLILGSDTMQHGKDMLVLNGSALNMHAPVVFAGYGIVDEETGRDDYAGLDVKGKIVIVKLGASDSADLREAFRWREAKQKAATSRGALAVVELYNASIAWTFIVQFANRETIVLRTTLASDMPYLWLNDGSGKLAAQLKTQPLLTGSLSTSGLVREPISSQNVIGFIEGSDPKLKNEYVLLSAHYDHIGTRQQPNQTDTIFNGARDNGMGTTALLAAAKAFAQKPPKRSIICLALTAEEVGLLGSQYFVEHPLLPLDKIVFNLNVDGAGYNDTTIVTVIGWERTTAMQDLAEGAKAFGLGVVSDPAPDQNLFDRSDNVNFAMKGIPAPTFSEGFRSFDAEIGKYYHQVADQPDEYFNFAYLHRFCQAYIHAARRIADRRERPRWQNGDKYEPAFKRLYGMQ